MSSLPTAERRLRATRLQIETAVAVVGCIVVLAGDTQSLSLIPLVPRLETEYGLSASQASWALSALSLVGAAWIPTITRLGDRLGMRRLVLASLVISLAGNLITALAHGFPLFVVGRAMLGLSAASALIYAILRIRSTSERRTSRGVGVITVAIGLGIAISYLLSGAVIQANGTVRTVFWLLTALSLVALLAAWAILPDAPIRSKDPVDWGGAIGMSAGLVCIVLAITEGNTWGWSSARVLGLIAGGVLIFAIWTWYEGHHTRPLINVRRVANRTAMPSFIIGGIASSLAVYTNLVQVTYVQMPKKLVGYGLSLTVLQTGYILCAIAAGVIAGGFLTGPAVGRFGPRAVIAAGAILAAASFFFQAYNHDQAWQFVVGNAAWGLGFAFAYAGAGAAYLLEATPGEAAMYSSANTVISLGIGGLGAGIFAAVLTSAATIPHTPIPAPAIFGRMYLYAGAVCLVMLGLGLIVRKPRFVPADSAAAPAAASASAPLV